MINIPFQPDMALMIITGYTTMTCRTKRYGNPGERFEVTYGGKKALCEIIGLEHIRLETVAFTYHRQEGFKSVEGFINKWVKIHPKAKYQPNQLVWLHKFNVLEIKTSAKYQAQDFTHKVKV